MSEFFLNIVNMSISASWIVLTVLFLRLLLKKAPKWIVVLLWGIVAVRLICPFSIESIMSLIPSAETISPQVLVETPEINTGFPILNNTINPIIQGSTITVDPGKSINVLKFSVLIFSKVWVAGIAGMLLYSVINYFRIKRKVRTAVLLRDNIYQSESVISPFVLGIVKPKIYLPFAMNERDMNHVIAHEKAHIHRKDHWWKPFGFFVLTLHWFNPLMWLGYVFLCRDIELACDEKVVKGLDNEQKADYSQALLTCSVNRRMIAACPLAFGEVGVKNRVKSILNYKRPAFWIVMIAIVASIVVAVCFLTNPASNTLDHIEYLNFESERQGTVSVLVSDGETYTPVGAVGQDLLNELCDIKISKNNISLSRSEERDKSHTLVLQTAESTGPTNASYVEGWQIHFDATFTSVWVNNGVKPTLSYRVINPMKAKQIYEDIADCVDAEKLTWTYQPMLSYTGHSLKAFLFDFDYTRVEAACTEGEFCKIDVEGQPRGTEMRFENGITVYWSPVEAVMEKVPQKAEVTFAIYNDETQAHKCTVMIECVSRDTSSAEFVIYLKDPGGLQMISSGDDIMLIEQSPISDVGGADNHSNMVIEIVDRTVSEGLFTDDVLEQFWNDEKYTYVFPSLKSKYVIVRFRDGSEMTVTTALEKGFITIADLDRWKIQYYKTGDDGELEWGGNGYIIDLYYPTLGHFQSLYEQTPEEQIQEKYDNEEFVITKTHYYNSKKEWCAAGYTYKYRLEITGGMNNVSMNTTYIVLSNRKDITFDETWKASGLSSLSSDYFKLSDAIIVGHRFFD